MVYYLQQQTIQLIVWVIGYPDLNLIKYLSDYFDKWTAIPPSRSSNHLLLDISSCHLGAIELNWPKGKSMQVGAEIILIKTHLFHYISKISVFYSFSPTMEIVTTVIN